MSTNSKLDVSPFRDSPLGQPSEFIFTMLGARSSCAHLADGKPVVCRDSVTALKCLMQQLLETPPAYPTPQENPCYGAAFP